MSEPTPPTVTPTPPAAAAPAAEPTPKPRPIRFKSERLAAFEAWLLEGATPAQAIRYAGQLWKMNRPRAEAYLQEIRRRWTHAARSTDYLCHLWQARRQREHLLDVLLREGREFKEPTIRLRMYLLAHQLLRERDLLMQRVAEHRRKASRDCSPDSQARRRQQRGDIVWPADEWQERLANLRAAIAREPGVDAGPPGNGLADSGDPVAEPCRLPGEAPASVPPT